MKQSQQTRGIVLFITATALFSSVLCTSELRVVGPAHLKTIFVKTEGKIPHELSTEQHVPWGKSLNGKLQIADPIDACTPIKFDNEFSLSQRPFLLIEVKAKDSCTIDQKIYHAQNHGSQLVILILNDASINRISNSDMNKLKLITIPVLSVTNSVGKTLLEEVRNSERDSRPTLVATFAPKSVSKNFLEIYLEAGTIESYILLNYIRLYDLAHPDQYQYKINYKIDQQILEDEDDTGLTSEQSKAIRDNKDLHCYGNGKYCDLNQPSVMREIIRQTCVADVSMQKMFAYATVILSLFENYDVEIIKKIVSQDTSPILPFNFDDHYKTALYSTNISENDLDSCFNGSFIVGNNKDQSNQKLMDNYILENNRAKFEELQNHSLLPFALIHNAQIPKLTSNYAQDVVRQLCLANEDDKTEVCTLLFKVKKAEKKSLTTAEIWIIVLSSLTGAALICIAAAKYYNRYQKRSYSDELDRVDSLVQSYIELNANHEQAPSSSDP